jgi:bifunctional DNase/RNase
MRCLVQLGSLDFADESTWQRARDGLPALLLLLSAITWLEAAREGAAAMPVTAGVGFIEMRIAKAVGFGPPLAEEPFHCVVLDEISGDRHLVISIGESEAFSLAARLQGVEFGRPMTYDFAVALVRGLGGHVRQVRIDRLVDGIYAAAVEVEGPLGAQSVDARPSDALNLAAITDAQVFVSPELLDDFERLQDDDSAEAGLLRLALTVPHMRIARVTERDL